MRQHYFAYIISIRKLLPLVLVPFARLMYSIVSGKPVDVIIGSDIAITAILIFVRIVRVWAVKLTVTDTHIYFEKGVFIKSKSTVRRSEITCCYVNQTPLLILLKAERTEIYTKSGELAKLYLPQSNNERNRLLK